MVGATEVTESRMPGAPAASISSMKMNCSTAFLPSPPNSGGQATPHHPFLKSAAWKARASGPSPSFPACRISARSDSETCSRTNARTSSRQASCSGEKAYRMGRESPMRWVHAVQAWTARRKIHPQHQHRRQKTRHHDRAERGPEAAEMIAHVAGRRHGERLREH